MLVTAGKLDYVVASEGRRHVQERVVALVACVFVAQLGHWVFLGIEGF